MNGAPAWVLTIIHVTIAAFAFATGLGASSARLAAIRNKPSLMFRALLAVLVVVPVIAVVLVKLVVTSSAVGGGILIAALAIGPVMAFRKTRTEGAEELDFALGLDVTLLVLSLIYVPLAVAVVGAAFHRDLRLSVGDVAGVVLPLQLVPLLIGLAVGRFAGQLAARIEKPLTLATNIALGIVVLVVLAMVAKPLLALGVRTWILLASFACMTIAAGHLLGGPGGETRKVVATFSALRFPGLAIAISALAVDKGVMPVVLAYVVCSALLLSVYLAVSRAAHKPVQPHGGVPAT